MTNLHCNLCKCIVYSTSPCLSRWRIAWHGVAWRRQSIANPTWSPGQVDLYPSKRLARFGTLIVGTSCCVTASWMEEAKRKRWKREGRRGGKRGGGREGRQREGGQVIKRLLQKGCSGKVGKRGKLARERYDLPGYTPAQEETARWSSCGPWRFVRFD